VERFYRDLARALGLLHGRVEFGVRLPTHLDQDSVVGVDQGADGLDAALRDLDGVADADGAGGGHRGRSW
jgi:hypothetical protein